MAERRGPFPIPLNCLLFYIGKSVTVGAKVQSSDGLKKFDSLCDGLSVELAAVYRFLTKRDMEMKEDGHMRYLDAVVQLQKVTAKMEDQFVSSILHLILRRTVFDRAVPTPSVTQNLFICQQAGNLGAVRIKLKGEHRMLGKFCPQMDYNTAPLFCPGEPWNSAWDFVGVPNSWYSILLQPFVFF